MDTARQRAYRRLIYWAMLDMRAHIPSSPYSAHDPVWSPKFWLRLRRRHHYNLSVADWLHNLAQFAAGDFEKFDESWFWREHEQLIARFPELRGQRYYERFEQELAGVQSVQ